jgi:hypothetical protein
VRSPKSAIRKTYPLLINRGFRTCWTSSPPVPNELGARIAAHELGDDFRSHRNDLRRVLGSHPKVAPLAPCRRNRATRRSAPKSGPTPVLLFPILFWSSFFLCRVHYHSDRKKKHRYLRFSLVLSCRASLRACLPLSFSGELGNGGGSVTQWTFPPVLF